ncbi:hypothetical protein AAMO2058_001238300 [Amorphochlora amoebiformis]
MSFTELINRIILARNSSKVSEFLDIDREELLRRNTGPKMWDVLNLGRCYDHCCAAAGESRHVDIPNLPKLKLVNNVLFIPIRNSLQKRNIPP